jgi:hypothetical protein
VRGLRTIPLAALAALLALAPAASASTHLLRPTTTAAGGQWTATPAGSDIAAALADNVTQPSVPDTASGFITSPQNGNSYAAVAVPAPALATGENITGATAWFYLGTGTTRSASLVVASGTTVLGSAAVPSGQAPKWYAVPVPTALTPAQAASLYLAIAPAGNTSTAVKAYAAYVDVETDALPPSGTVPAPSPTTSTGTSNPGTNGDQTIVPNSPFAATLASTAALTAKPSGVVGLPVICPAIQLSGCRGTVAIELLATRSSKAATTARRRKIVLRSTRRFKIAPGGKATVPVVLDRRTVRALRGKRRVRARVTITTDLGDGRRAVTVRTVTLRERRTAPRPGRQAARFGSRH